MALGSRPWRPRTRSTSSIVLSDFMGIVGHRYLPRAWLLFGSESHQRPPVNKIRGRRPYLAPQIHRQYIDRGSGSCWFPTSFLLKIGLQTAKSPCRSYSSRFGDPQGLLIESPAPVRILMAPFFALFLTAKPPPTAL